MKTKHLINREKYGIFLYPGFYKKRLSFFDKYIMLKKFVPERTLCGLEGDDFREGDGLTTPENCNCDLCLQVEDNIQKNWGT